MKLTIANNEAIKYACKHFHYSKTTPIISHAYNVYNDKEEWCGVIVFGRGANNNLAKSVSLRNGEVLELERVALNGKQEQTSKAVAIALKLLHKQDPLVKLVVSYADHRQKHVGTIYKATNWLYLGLVKTSDEQYYYKGKWTHQRTINRLKNKEELKRILPKRFNANKFKYVYVYDKELQKKYKAIAKDYPQKEDLTEKMRI